MKMKIFSLILLFAVSVFTAGCCSVISGGETTSGIPVTPDQDFMNTISKYGWEYSGNDKKYLNFRISADNKNNGQPLAVQDIQITPSNKINLTDKTTGKNIAGHISVDAVRIFPLRTEDGTNVFSVNIQLILNFPALKYAVLISHKVYADKNGTIVRSKND